MNNLMYLIQKRDELLRRVKFYDYDAVYRQAAEFKRRADLKRLNDVIQLIKKEVKHEAA